MNDFIKNLRDTPFFWSRLGFCYDPPRRDAEGKPIIFSRDYDEYNKVHRDFADAGVKYHTTILHSGWVADGEYDYSLTDEILDALFEGNPDIYYMPRVKLNVPPDWCRNHPEDTFLYYYSPRHPQVIASLAETPRHDYFGSDMAGYGVNGGKGVYRDDRVNYGGLIGLQSHSSRKWVEDASETLTRLLKHLSESRYADRIIGIHVAYSMCGETNMWGSWAPLGEGRRGDFGINACRRFVEYGVNKYGSEEAAREAWGGSLEPPPPINRQNPGDTVESLFFAADSRESDYFDFLSETNVDAIEAFCKVVKDASSMFGRELAAGVFYGYMYLPQSPNAGHLAIQRVIDSPYIDFVSSPKGYYRCLAGDPGGEQGPSESIARKKAWLDEIDNHTHLDRRPDGRAANMEESKTLLWREGIKNLTHGQGFWWMDLGEGWFADPELMAQITAMSELQKRINRVERVSAAQILLVVDDASLARTKISYGLNHGLMYNLHSELKLTGAPVDTLRLSDLDECDISQYRLVVFTNRFLIEPERRERLKAALEGKLAVWHHAVGILAPDYDPANFTALTGFTFRELPRPNDVYDGYPENIGRRYCRNHRHISGDFPLFTPEIEGGEVLLRYPDELEGIGGLPNCVIKDNVCVCCAPALQSAELRSLAKRAGVDILCDADCTVFADNRVVGYFTKDAFSGTIMLPWEKDGSRLLNVDIPAHGRLVIER